MKRDNPYEMLAANLYQDKKKINREIKSFLDNAFIASYHVKIGEPVPCVKCGKRNIENNNSFLCEDCIADYGGDADFFLACDCCGSRIYNRDEAIDIGEEILCPTCASATNKEREGDV